MINWSWQPISSCYFNQTVNTLHTIYSCVYPVAEWSHNSCNFCCSEFKDLEGKIQGPTLAATNCWPWHLQREPIYLPKYGKQWYANHQINGRWAPSEIIWTTQRQRKLPPTTVDMSIPYIPTSDTSLSKTITESTPADSILQPMPPLDLLASNQQLAAAQRSLSVSTPQHA